MKRRPWTLITLALASILALAACSPKPGLKLSSISVAPGETIKVEYTAGKDFKENAWIGIIPSHVEHGSETINDQHDITYQYLKGSTAGTLTFTAPMEAGSYDFRMHDTDGGGVEVASATFKVVGPATSEAPAPAPAATADSAPKASGFGVGDRVLVEWKGSWWPAKVIRIQKGAQPYRIHYDGYSASWDEWVVPSRVRPK